MRRLIFTSVLFLVFSSVLFAQKEEHVRAPYPEEVTIGNINVDLVMKDTSFVVSYSLRFGDKVKSCAVSLQIRDDDNANFRTVDSKLLAGDCGKLESDGKKEIRFDFSSIKNSLAGKPIEFNVKVSHINVKKSNGFASAVAGLYPYQSFGLMGGWCGSHIGAYAKVRTGFKFSQGECLSNGHYPDGSALWTTGNKSSYRFSATAGALVRATDWCFPYVGVGYGSSKVLWEDYNNKWLSVTDYKVQGVTAELGVLFNIKHFVISVGASTTSFKYVEGEIGIGYMF